MTTKKEIVIKQILEQAAEESALKLYPKEEAIMYHSAFGKLEFDKHADQREAFMKGFKYGAKWMVEQIKGGSK